MYVFLIYWYVCVWIFETHKGAVSSVKQIFWYVSTERIDIPI